MPVLFEYIGDYGWHIGRLLLWPLLFVFGSAATFVIALASQIACALFKWPVLVSFLAPLIVPLLCSLLFVRKLQRKLAGEPFVVNLGNGFRRGSTAWLVSRGHRHFRALVMLESVIWGTSIVAQLGVVAAPLISTHA